MHLICPAPNSIWHFSLNSCSFYQWRADQWLLWTLIIICKQIEKNPLTFWLFAQMLLRHITSNQCYSSAHWMLTIIWLRFSIFLRRLDGLFIVHDRREICKQWIDSVLFASICHFERNYLSIFGKFITIIKIVSNTILPSANSLHLKVVLSKSLACNENKCLCAENRAIHLIFVLLHRFLDITVITSFGFWSWDPFFLFS